MKKYLIRLIPLCLLGLSAISCLRKELRSIDFTEEAVFTEGIEGPAVNTNGDLFAVNFERQGTIGVVDALGKGQVFLELPQGSIGNGIRFDLQGHMFIADYLGHKVYKVPKGSRKAEVWIENDKMNQPNDLAVAKDGTIYLSDPNWANSTGQLWMVKPDREIILLEADMGTTNGVALSPDDSKLYVNESIQRRIWQYDIAADGELVNKRLLIDFEDYGLDGMRCDMKGNLYIARYEKGTVLILTPDGRVIDEVLLTGQKPSNITFGGPDGKTCFVTMADRGSIEIFRAPFPGRYFSITSKETN